MLFAPEPEKTLFCFLPRSYLIQQYLRFQDGLEISIYIHSLMENNFIHRNEIVKRNIPPFMGGPLFEAVIFCAVFDVGFSGGILL